MASNVGDRNSSVVDESLQNIPSEIASDERNTPMSSIQATPTELQNNPTLSEDPSASLMEPSRPRQLDVGINDEMINLYDSEDQESGFSIPRYCRSTARAPSALSTFTIDLQTVLADIEESGDGGDSDVEGSLCAELDEAVECAELEKRVNAFDNEIVEFTDRNVTILNDEEMKKLEDDDLDKYVPTPPEDWVPSLRKTHKNEPEFKDVDNPGNWPEFSFRPEFLPETKGGGYHGHYLPTGAVPVPKNIDGVRKFGDWTFHYDGWQSTVDENNENNEYTKYRSDATKNNLFPESRRGCLDAELLEKMGLTREKMQMGDSLFFYQLLFPICNPKKSGIPGDPRQAYYSEVTNFSNLYACSLGLIGGQYSHAFRSIKVQELLHFDGVVVRDGALGGSNGSIYQRWMVGESMYDSATHDAISYDRFLQIK